MPIYQQHLKISTGRRGTFEITREVQKAVAASGADNGLCHLFIRHTSASLIVCENADPTVREDLERFLQRLAPDGDASFVHTAEGPDDMPAHIRTVLTQTELTVPVESGRLALGTWQGIYVYEHRYAAGTRHVLVTVQGG
jgi:secondary thiamine-phosphate synthase enzyme